VKRRAQERVPAGIEESGAQQGARGRTTGGQVSRRWLAVFIVAAVAAPAVFVSVLVVLSQSGGQSEEPSTTVTGAGPRAAIVDQLGLTQPSPELVGTVTDML